ncbi:MAG: asparaginase [Candidatus Zixiibacteriota bacterium]
MKEQTDIEQFAAGALEPAAFVYRGDTVEASHFAAVAVVDKNGKLTHALGNPDFVTMARSSIKPFQLAPLVITGAADEYGFSNPNLSIMAGSHSGTDDHVKWVRANLKMAGNDPSMLKCGSHWPIWMQTSNTYPEHGEDKDPLRHNCSGKHSGFLALARYLKTDPSHYLDPDSEPQRLVKKAISDLCEFPIEKMAYGTDGCSAPNYPISLRSLALGFKKLANQDGASGRELKALSRIREAMSEFPVLFSGTGRFDHNLMVSYPFNAISKGGAEALQGFGFVEPSIGVAVKISDGNARALGTICLEVLRQLGVVKSTTIPPYLQQYERPEVKNAAGLVTGHIVPQFRLREVG